MTYTFSDDPLVVGLAKLINFEHERERECRYDAFMDKKEAIETCIDQLQNILHDLGF